MSALLADTTFVGLPADTWAALGTWATALATVALIWVAYSQIRQAAREHADQTRRANQAQADQMKHETELHVQQTRPFITPDFDGRSTLVYLSIKNLGQTVALNVIVELDDPFQPSGDRDVSWAQSALFTTGLPTFPPGKDLRFYFDSFQERVSAQLPMQFGMTVHFEDFNGRRYSDRYLLDLAALGHVLQTNRNIDDLVGEVKKVRETLVSFRVGNKGVFVQTADRFKVARRKNRPLTFAQSRRAFTLDGVGGLLRLWIQRTRHRFNRTWR